MKGSRSEWILSNEQRDQSGTHLSARSRVLQTRLSPGLEVFVRLSEEIVYLMVEVVGVFAQGAIARVRDNPGENGGKRGRDATR
jgi:hypothetical protein